MKWLIGKINSASSLNTSSLSEGDLETLDWLVFIMACTGFYLLMVAP